MCGRLRFSRDISGQQLKWLIKCTKGNTMKEVALKIDKNTHFLDQLPKYVIFSSLIDIFMLISYQACYYFFPSANVQYTHFLCKWFLKYVLSLQVIVEIDNNFAGHYFQNEWLIMQMHDYFITNLQDSWFFFFPTG